MYQLPVASAGIASQEIAQQRIITDGVASAFMWDFLRVPPFADASKPQATENDCFACFVIGVELMCYNFLVRTCQRVGVFEPRAYVGYLQLCASILLMIALRWPIGYVK